MRPAALLLAASLLLCGAAAARAAGAACALALDKAEVDRLGAALAASPKTFLTYGPDGKTITGVNAAALRAHGFSDAAVACMEATYGARAPAGGPGSAPAAPAPGIGISNVDRDKVYAFFAKRSNAALWRPTASTRFGKKSVKSLNNKSMTNALEGTDPANFDSILQWLTAAITQLAPTLAIIAPILAQIMTAVMGIIGGVPAPEAAPAGGL